jgi:hypothetical protein
VRNFLEIFATPSFDRWAKKNMVLHQDLITAAHDMANGLVDANLGGHVVKKRIAFKGRGKRSGARTIVATNFERRWIFLFGFEKSERANISKAELKALQELAKNLLGFNATQIVMAVRERQLIDLKRLEE